MPITPPFQSYSLVGYKMYKINLRFISEKKRIYTMVKTKYYGLIVNLNQFWFLVIMTLFTDNGFDYVNSLESFLKRYSK